MKVHGSYFRNDFSGLGAVDDQSLSFPDQTLIGIIQAQPSLTYSEWATQTGDVTWVEQTPTVNYQAFAITDFQLVAVANTTSAEVQTIAVISPTLTFASTLTTAFNGTPYAYSKTEAIYAQLDPAQPPQIYFLYWLTLRPATDPNTGPTSLNYVATGVLGVLSYVLEIPIGSTDRARPSVSFTTALNTQASKGPLTIPMTPAILTTTPALPAPAAPGPTLSPAAPAAPAPVVLTSSSPLILSAPAPVATQQASLTAPTSGDTLTALVLVGLGATAAVYAYKYVKGRKAAS